MMSKYYPLNECKDSKELMFKPDTMVFEKAEPAEKQKMIDDAISETDSKLYYSRQCLLAMIKWQQKLLAEAYAAFEHAQLTPADFEDERF